MSDGSGSGEGGGHKGADKQGRGEGGSEGGGRRTGGRDVLCACIEVNEAEGFWQRGLSHMGRSGALKRSVTAPEEGIPHACGG